MDKIFLNNKYTIWYKSIIASAQNKARIRLRKNNILYKYYENHHIIPKSMGGSNCKTNLVLLTAKEHYICHLLLTRMCLDIKHHNKMLYAFNRITNKLSVINSSMYERLRIEFSKMKSATTKGTLNHFYGKSHSSETKQYLSGVCANFGIDNGFYGKNHTIETKIHLSNIAKAREIQIPPPPQYGAKNHFAKCYKITDPVGKVFTIKCLKTFVEDNNLCGHTIKIYKNKGIIPALTFDRPYRIKNIQQKRNCEGYSIETIKEPSGNLPSIDQTVTGT